MCFLAARPPKKHKKKRILGPAALNLKQSFILQPFPPLVFFIVGDHAPLRLEDCRCFGLFPVDLATRQFIAFRAVFAPATVVGTAARTRIADLQVFARHIHAHKIALAAVFEVAGVDCFRRRARHVQRAEGPER